MKAMVLAAGLGTRLRPLTDHLPKALVEVGGRTLLEITLARLRAFGVREVIINVHHFAEMIADYLRAQDEFGMSIELSCEDDLLLDTGGGLKKAAHFFLGTPDEPFLLHNVDVISTIDFSRLTQAHRESRALVTLAVQRRETERYLLFDDQHQLCGRRAGREGAAEMARPAGKTEALAFTGIHVISPRLFTVMKEEGAFPIIDAYLRLAAEGESIVAFRADEYYWRDLGRLESLQRAEEDAKKNFALFDSGPQ